MEILSYEPSLLAEVTAAYNREIAGLPYCYPVPPEVFEAVMPGGWSYMPMAEAEQVLVAREDGEVTGFVHCAKAKPDWEDGNGIIRFLCHRPGHRRAGSALVDAAEVWLRERGAPLVRAFHQDCNYYFYHLAYAYASDRRGHLFALMGARGYERWSGEVYLEWDNYLAVDPGPPPIDVELDFHWRCEEIDAGRPSLILGAAQGEHHATCRNCACVRPGRPPEAAAWFMTNQLWVDAPLRGRGLAKWLLARTRFEMHGKDYRRAIISTNWQNHDALWLYSNHGYRVADWTYGFTKNLT